MAVNAGVIKACPDVVVAKRLVAEAESYHLNCAPANVEDAVNEAELPEQTGI